LTHRNSEPRTQNSKLVAKDVDMQKPPKKSYRIVKKEEPFVVKQAPHIHSNKTVNSKMSVFIFALLPAVGVALFFNSYSALWLVAHGIVSALFFEFLGRQVFKFSYRIPILGVVALGLMFALNFSSEAPWWFCWVASFVGIFLGSKCLSRSNKYVFHPVLLGLLFVVAVFPEYTLVSQIQFDAFHKALPLVNGEETVSFLSLVIGNYPGAIGVTCKIALLAGFVLLVVKRVISWKPSVVYLFSVMLVAFLLGRNPAIEVLSGMILFVGLFIISDFATSPLQMKAKIIYAFGAGVLAELLRCGIGYPEGALLGVLIMNGFTPWLDRCIKIRPLGVNAA